MILWSLARTSRSLAIFEQAAYWAVHILAAHQDDLSNHFAKSGADKFAGLGHRNGRWRGSIVEGLCDPLAMQNRVHVRGWGPRHIRRRGAAASTTADVAPLVFHGGKYALAARKTEPAVLSGNSPRDSDISFGEDFLGYLLWRAAQHFQSRVIVHLQAHGLNPDTFMILAMLLHRDARTMSQLASGLPQPGARTSRPCSTR